MTGIETAKQIYKITYICTPNKLNNIARKNNDIMEGRMKERKKDIFI